MILQIFLIPFKGNLPVGTVISHEQRFFRRLAVRKIIQCIKKCIDKDVMYGHRSSIFKRDLNRGKLKYMIPLILKGECKASSAMQSV